MKSGKQSSSGGQLGALIGIVLLVGLAILVIKWALITAAILAIPYAIWWTIDHYHGKRPSEDDQSATPADDDEIEPAAEFNRH